MTATVEAPPVVEPAYRHAPARHRSMLQAVARVNASVGRELDAEQRLAVDVLTGVRADGRPATLEGALIAARQNLKTYVLEAIVLTMLCDPHNGIELIAWSAHEFDTAAESFRHFEGLFDNDDHPHLRRRLKRIRHGSGKEEIELAEGRCSCHDARYPAKRLRFKARTSGSARGLTGDAVVLDEAFALQETHMGAIVPILSTRPRALILYGSSACKESSTILHDVVRRGRAGGMAYAEWCAPGSFEAPGCEVSGCRHDRGVPGCALDRLEHWRAANPAMGRRISVDFIGSERGALPPVEFARERLGWHEPLLEADAPPLTEADWQDRADPTSAIEGPVVLAVDVHPNRTSASIAAAGRRLDGKAHVELVDIRAGVDWVPARVAELARAHELRELLVGTGDDAVMRPAIVGDEVALGPLLDPSGRLGGEQVWPVLMKTADVARACTRLLDAVKADEVRHPGQVQVSTAIGAASRRDVGDGGWAWGKRKSSGVDISGLVAVTNAHDALCRAIESEVWGFWD